MCFLRCKYKVELLLLTRTRPVLSVYMMILDFQIVKDYTMLE